MGTTRSLSTVLLSLSSYTEELTSTPVKNLAVSLARAAEISLRAEFSAKMSPQLLVFSVTPFKIDQNKNQNKSIDKVQNLGKERR